MKTITINVSEPVYRDFQLYAKAQDRTASELVRQAMEEFRRSHLQPGASPTRLRAAAEQGTLDAARRLRPEYLIVLGAKTTIRNKKGKSPLDVAAKACLYMKPSKA
jgi:predicted transcriptional regulator